MIAFTIPFPDIDPVAFSIGPVSIKWYGLAYMAGLILGWLYVRNLLRQSNLWRDGKPPFGVDRVDDLLVYIAVGVIVGGRLGYVILYEPETYFANPVDILKVWKGGMSFHGAILGSAISIWLFARAYGVSPWSAMDICAAANPIGLFFGRMANFINGELFGRVSDAPWAMVFPHAKVMFPAIEPASRHPSQLYEALLEGVVLFIVLRFLTHHRDALKSPGLIIGVFLAGYALARITAEIFREPHAGHALNIGPLTAGQIYSVPMLLLGLYFIWRARTGTTS